MSSYSFTTKLVIDAPIDAVWNVLLDYSMWPTWWKGIHDLSVNTSGEFPIITVKLGYKLYALSLILTNEKLEKSNKIAFRSSGDLEGTGVFNLQKTDSGTAVTFDWNVQTTKTWMNVCSPIARPFFAYSHHNIMQWFAEGLAKKLNARLSYQEFLTNNV